MLEIFPLIFFSFGRFFQKPRSEQVFQWMTNIHNERGWFQRKESGYAVQRLAQKIPGGRGLRKPCAPGKKTTVKFPSVSSWNFDWSSDYFRCNVLVVIAAYFNFLLVFLFVDKRFLKLSKKQFCHSNTLHPPLSSSIPSQLPTGSCIVCKQPAKMKWLVPNTFGNCMEKESTSSVPHLATQIQELANSSSPTSLCGGMEEESCSESELLNFNDGKPKRVSKACLRCQRIHMSCDNGGVYIA